MVHADATAPRTLAATLAERLDGFFVNIIQAKAYGLHPSPK
jgi:hypothetical protein